MTGVLEFAETFKKAITFSVNDAAKLLRKSKNYTKIYLGRLTLKKIIQRITRDKYTFHDDPLLIATGLYTPSYLSLTTALEYHKMTTQLPTHIHVVTPKKKRTTNFQKTRIIFHTSKHFWGYKNYPYQGFTIPIADPEKTILDCLHHGVPTHLVHEALTLKKINKRKITDYILRTHDKSLAKRSGYLLERNGIDIHPRVKKLIDNNYTLIELNGPRKGTKNKKWKIIENVVIE